MTLQCVIVRLNLANNETATQDPVWHRNKVLTRELPNHEQVYNSTTGGSTDLVITNVTLEYDNDVYNCTSADGTIASSLVLNVTGIHNMYH